MSRIKLTGLAVVFIFSALFIVSGAVHGQDSIKVGVYLPMTGTVASYGEMEWAGMQIATAMEPEVLGKKVVLVLEDTKSDKIEAANAVTLLVEKEKVAGIIGEAISGNTMAGNPISEAAKIPSVSPTATNPLVNSGEEICIQGMFYRSVPGRGGGQICSK